jgi:hypothetical protein
VWNVRRSAVCAACHIGLVEGRELIAPLCAAYREAMRLAACPHRFTDRATARRNPIGSYVRRRTSRGRLCKSVRVDASPLCGVLFDWRGTLVCDPEEKLWLQAAAARLGRELDPSSIVTLLHELEIAARRPDLAQRLAWFGRSSRSTRLSCASEASPGGDNRSVIGVPSSPADSCCYSMSATADCEVSLVRR